jgi:hypothetical protein
MHPEGVRGLGSALLVDSIVAALVREGLTETKLIANPPVWISTSPADYSSSVPRSDKGRIE